MTYIVRTLRRAKDDVAAIIDWMAVERQSPEGAAKWLRAYEDAVSTLRRSPDAFSFAPESDEVNRHLRQFFFRTKHGKTYRGLFFVEGDEIRILRVRGPGQCLLDSSELE